MHRIIPTNRPRASSRAAPCFARFAPLSTPLRASSQIHMALAQIQAHRQETIEFNWSIKAAAFEGNRRAERNC